MSDQVWAYVVTLVGLAGFWLGGKKIWWSWYVNIANQVLWVALAIFTEQYGFLIGVPFYLFVFTRNAILWTREHRAKCYECEQMGRNCTLHVGQSREN